ITSDCRNIPSEEMLKVRETLRRNLRIGSESWRWNFRLTVVDIDAAESDHELHRSWNSISLKCLERFRMAAQRFFLLHDIKQPQDWWLMSDQGADMSAMMRCEFEAD